jgi:hypothetical protein
VLREADGVISAIRIIDRINLTGDADEMPPTVFQTTLVIVLKSGAMRGPARIAASGLPDPKRMTKDGVLYRIQKARKDV